MEGGNLHSFELFRKNDGSREAGARFCGSQHRVLVQREKLFYGRTHQQRKLFHRTARRPGGDKSRADREGVNPRALKLLVERVRQVDLRGLEDSISTQKRCIRGRHTNECTALPFDHIG